MTKFIAEISSNHNKDLERCLKFVDVSAEIECDAVKYQLFKVEELFAPDILEKSSEHRRRKEWELPLYFIPKIAERCREREIEFSCTPFYLRAVDELLPYVDFYKIASYELTWPALLRKCAQTGKPVVLSTGMATLDEVENAVKVLMNSGCKDLAILHCVSAYPTPVAECNLGAIETMRNEIRNQKSEIRLRFGWSDHSVDPDVIYRAAGKWQANMIEFHLDLDSEGFEFSSGHCWLPEKIATVIEKIKSGDYDFSKANEADGDGVKSYKPSEADERLWRTDPSDGFRPFKEMRRNGWQEQ